MTGSERIGHYELYVFDWDGTVMDTTALIARGMQEAAKALLLPIPDYDVCRGTIGLSNSQAMAVVAPTLPESRWDEFWRAYRNWYLVREAEVVLFPHLRELFDAMKKHGVRMAIATGKSRRGSVLISKQPARRTSVFPNRTRRCWKKFSWRPGCRPRTPS